jgi:4-O-beta-D-mannosyl-D-glucose phosphorylase
MLPPFNFQTRLAQLRARHEAVVTQSNTLSWDSSNWFCRAANPAVTHEHAPLAWRYDLNPATNPRLLERLPVFCAFNAGAIEWNGNIAVAVRVEGHDRKSFFAIAESPNGIDNFRFHDEPVTMPETEDPDTNVYDMRLVKHADGWVYGLFCTERKDPAAKPGDLSSAVAQCGIARSKDLKTWVRLPDLKSLSAQQRNVVLHPEFINGKYALYTRPQDGFIDAGSGGGIGFAFCDDMTRAVTGEERIVDRRIYHTIKEVKNGEGPAPIKSPIGWIHLAHGVRGTASGLRYVLYVYVTALDEPWKITHAPGGAFMVPIGDERVGDLTNILFSNGWVLKNDGTVLIYYASCDTRLHVAATTLDRLMDYCVNTPADPLRTAACVAQRVALIRQNS